MGELRRNSYDMARLRVAASARLRPDTTATFIVHATGKVNPVEIAVQRIGNKAAYAQADIVNGIVPDTTYLEYGPATTIRDGAEFTVTTGNANWTLDVGVFNDQEGVTIKGICAI